MLADISPPEPTTLQTGETSSGHPRASSRSSATVSIVPRSWKESFAPTCVSSLLLTVVADSLEADVQSYFAYRLNTIPTPRSATMWLHFRHPAPILQPSPKRTSSCQASYRLWSRSPKLVSETIASSSRSSSPSPSLRKQAVLTQQRPVAVRRSVRDLCGTCSRSLAAL